MTTGLTGKRFEQINRLRIGLLYQVDLPLPPPFFYFLFASDRSESVFVAFEPNKEVDVIAGCKTADDVSPVLVRPADEVVRHANIQGSMFAVGH